MVPPQPQSRVAPNSDSEPAEIISFTVPVQAIPRGARAVGKAHTNSCNKGLNSSTLFERPKILSLCFGVFTRTQHQIAVEV